MGTIISSSSNSTKIYGTCLYRVLWCTKYCRPVLGLDVVVRLRQILLEVAKDEGVTIASFDLRSDRVELTIETTPGVELGKVVRSLKRRSSRLLRQEFRSCRTRVPTLWTSRWYAETVEMRSGRDRFLEEAKKH